MLTKIEQLGDRLLSLVVPHVSASAGYTCCNYVGICDRTRDWWKCGWVDNENGSTAPWKSYCSANPPWRRC
jgi:hypothetical protein